MESLKDTIFSEIKFPADSDVSLSNKILHVKKWHWDYSDCLKFQKSVQAIIQKNRDYKVYIFCNHPHCFTLGRGNERDQEDLVDFNEDLISALKFPVHKIHRGGGLTFHYPGQWIFYPIVSINQKFTLDDHMCWQLNSVKSVLKSQFGLSNAMAAKKLMGVWVDRKKLASIGVGLSRFVTEHGIALNLVHDTSMFNELHKTNPCGMNPTTYIALNKVIEINSDNLIDNFHNQFLKLLENK